MEHDYEPVLVDNGVLYNAQGLSEKFGLTVRYTLADVEIDGGKGRPAGRGKRGVVITRVRILADVGPAIAAASRLDDIDCRRDAPIYMHEAHQAGITGEPFLLSSNSNPLNLIYATWDGAHIRLRLSRLWQESSMTKVGTRVEGTPEFSELKRIYRTTSYSVEHRQSYLVDGKTAHPIGRPTWRTWHKIGQMAM